MVWDQRKYWALKCSTECECFILWYYNEHCTRALGRCKKQCQS